MSLGRSVDSAVPVAGGIRVRLDDGSQRNADHVLLGTGYRVDASRYEFFSPELSKSIDCFGGYARLGEGLESSVPGLHFLGAPAIWSYGALMQFVVGTHYASRTLLRSLGKKAEVSRIQVDERLAAQVG
jgi:hypothetical protein